MHRSSQASVATELQRMSRDVDDGARPPVDISSAPEPLSKLPDLPTWQKWVLWTSVVLTAYANGLDNFTMTVYLNAAASQFNGIVQYTTLAVIQSMILAVSKPIFAKLADVLGRAAGFAIAILLFTIGTTTISSSNSIGGLAAGMVFFAWGNSGLSFNLSLLVADLTSPRWRCTISNVLSIHFVINFGIASKITDALVPRNWRWGVGMFSIINPCVTGPMIGVLAWQQYRSVQRGVIRKYPYQDMGFLRAVQAFFIDVDFLGLFCFSGGFLLLLLPLTIAEKAPNGYGSGYIIAMFVLGGSLLLAWPLVELRSPRPLVRLRSFFANPDVVVPGAILFVDQFSVALTMTPAYQWISITHGWGPGGATYFLYTQSLCLVIFGILAGFAATYTGRYKHVCIAGACIRIIGLGLMMKYRGADASTFQVVIPQVLMGLGGGLMTANVTVVAQAAVSHDELSIVTGFILLVLELGASIGSAVVGAVQQTLRSSLHQYLDPITGGNATVVNTIYAQGSLAVAKYPLGTPIRDATVHAWTDNMHQLIIAAVTLGAVNLLTCVALPDHELKDRQQNNVENDSTGVLAPVAARADKGQA
ncbi:Siderophore iron transporter mirC [Tolypocladium ophioglossoides CBS 100239]|uniref:Siderophore iron transporter mirC n=1 Tax=Tolypocladium ophioglossoides (strain CBS 100239) TaxID=1163406 RepID=A0A0L0MYC7_TOLOC|nr:Siderophore iron transporter mirC [Tolypocladium ophioglossoides CBS 100239]